MKMDSFKRYFLFMLIGLIAVILSYHFIDQQIVNVLAAYHIRQITTLNFLAEEPYKLVNWFVGVFYFYVGAKLCLRHSVRTQEYTLLNICHAVVAARFLVNFLKDIFGRYWPATFQCDNLSWLQNQAYGFNYFQTGVNYGSFPSGHLAIISAFSFALWFFIPKLRWFALIVYLMVLIGIVSLYYHFLSDIIAGTMLGGSIAYAIYLNANRQCK